MRLENCEKYHLKKIKIAMSLLTQPNGVWHKSFTLHRNKKAEPHYVFKILKKNSSSFCLPSYIDPMKTLKSLWRWAYSFWNSTCERDSPACEMQSLSLNLATSPINYAVPYGLEIAPITFLIFPKWGLFGKW